MFSQLHPPVYKCILPVYHAPFDQSEEAQGRPFPAWPQIKSSHQPLCLPTLMRAVYFEYLPARLEPDDVATRVEGYLSSRGVFEPEIIEQIRALTNSYKAFSPYAVGVDSLPHILSNALNMRQFDESFIAQMSKAIIEGFIYGNLDNFPGNERGAFAYTHELAHRFALFLRSGDVMDELSKFVHKTLNTLATQEKLSRKQKDQLWKQFHQANKQISHLAQKFEPIEEIFATYIGIYLLPPDVGNTVKTNVEQELNANGWYTAYEAFVDICDNLADDDSIAEAFFTFEYICRMLEQINIDFKEFLHKYVEIRKVMWSYHKMRDQVDDSNQDELDAVERESIEKIDGILELADISTEVFWSVSNTIDDEVMPQLTGLFSGGEEQLFQIPSHIPPQIRMIGKPSWNAIRTFVAGELEQKNEDNLSPKERIFYESIRQQLSERCGIVCPFHYYGADGYEEESCGFEEKLQRLYERIPERYKKYFNQPN